MPLTLGAVGAEVTKCRSVLGREGRDRGAASLGGFHEQWPTACALEGPIEDALAPRCSLMAEGRCVDRGLGRGRHLRREWRRRCPRSVEDRRQPQYLRSEQRTGICLVQRLS